MSQFLEWNRRRLLKALAAGGTIALPACDQLDVRVKNNPDAILYDEDGKPYIPPITDIEEFYRYQCCGRPEVDPDTWVLEFRDRGQVLGTLDKAYLDTLPVTEIELTLECIGASPRNPNINNAIWGGMPLAEVLAGLGIPDPGPAIREIRMAGADAYHASLPVETLADAPIWLIWEMNGESLPPEHGHPARLMVPGRYGIKNLKWITEIEYVDEIWEGYWDKFGWDHQGIYKVNGYILVPPSESVNDPPVFILGTAFAGTDPVVQVEISSNGGKTWKDCVLEYAPGPNRWVLWSYVFDPARSGAHTLEIRCTTASGAVTVGPNATDSKAGYDGGQRINLMVT